MPPLLQSAQLNPDVTITSAESDDEIESDDDRCVIHSVEIFYLLDWRFRLGILKIMIDYCHLEISIPFSLLYSCK